LVPVSAALAAAMPVAKETINSEPTRNGSLNDMDISSVFHVEASALCAGLVEVKNKQRVRPHHQIAPEFKFAFILRFEL
jgi:hypothetical protein